MKKHRIVGCPTLRFHYYYLQHILSFRVFRNHSTEASKKNEKVTEKLSRSKQILIEKGCEKKDKFQYDFFVIWVTFADRFWSKSWYGKVMKN